LTGVAAGRSAVIHKSGAAFVQQIRREVLWKAGKSWQSRGLFG